MVLKHLSENIKSIKKGKFVLLILFSISLSLRAQQPFAKSSIDWHGYTQFRFTTDFNNENNFSMQRLKFWIQSSPDFSRHWGFKVQTTLSGNQNEQFFLQDVMVFYRFNQFKLNFGQFVPEYSLERFQPDYTVPLTDRAPVINALIPNGTLGVRDLGMEMGWQSTNRKIQSWIGLFNGYGIKVYRPNNSGFMITHKTIFRLTSAFSAGYSVMFRKANDLKLKNILPDSILFSGNDFRYNFFAEYQTNSFHIQAEYLSAYLNASHSDGYYVLAAYNFHKNQLVASWNQYNNLINSISNTPEIHLGYNYLFNQDKIKLMVDNGFQIVNNGLTGYILTMQFQLFFK